MRWSRTLAVAAVLLSGTAMAQETTRPNDPLQPIDPTEPTQPLEAPGDKPVEPMRPTAPSDPGEEAAGQTRGIGQSGATSQEDMMNLRCEDYLLLSPDDVERTYYWFGGYLTGKSGAPGWRHETVMEWNDALVARCAENDSDRVLDVVESL